MKLLLLSLFSSALFAANFDLQQSYLLDAGVSNITLTNAATSATSTLVCAPGAARARISFSENNVAPAGTPMRPTGSTTYSTLNGNPAAVTIFRNWGDVSYWCEAVDSGGSALSPRKISSELLLPMIEPTCPAAGVGTFPIEVIGQRAYIVCRTVNIAVTVGTSNSLLIKAHNLGYKAQSPADGKCEAKLNSGSWVPITTANTTAIDEPAPYFGGVGSAFELRELLISDSLLGSFTSGDNQIRFRSNPRGSDGVSSGCRIIDLSVVKSTPISITGGSIVVSGGVATIPVSSSATITSGVSWGYVTRLGNDMYAAYNGNHLLTVVDGTHVSFTTCENHTGEILAGACSIANGTYPLFPTTQYASTGIYTQPTADLYRELVPYSQLPQDDPSTWAAPGGGDATRGSTFWHSATLVVPGFSYGGNNTSAHCESCHFKNGKDLITHGASNHSIEQRTIFHGGSWQDALDVATYIRSLGAVPATGRWYNPPFIPAPGLDSETSEVWRAGGGSAVYCPYDACMKRYLMPGGVTTNLGITGHLNYREIPFPNMFMTWDQWLAQTWPGDYPFAVAWATSIPGTCRDDALAGITSGNVASFKAFHCTGGSTSDFMMGLHDDFSTWNSQVSLAYSQSAPGAGGNSVGYLWPNPQNNAIYSAGLLMVMATIDVNATLGFEDKYDQVVAAEYGSTASSQWTRGYLQGGNIFVSSPHELGLSINGLYDQTLATWNFLTNASYVIDFPIGAGNRFIGNFTPFDTNYLVAFLHGYAAQRPIFYSMWLPVVAFAQESMGWTAPGDGSGLPKEAVAVWQSPFTGSIYDNGVGGFTAIADQTIVAEQHAKNYTDTLNRFSPADWCNYFVAQGYYPCSHTYTSTEIYNAYVRGFNTGNLIGAGIAGLLPALYNATNGWSVNQTVATNLSSAIGAIYTHNFAPDLAATFTSWTGKPGTGAAAPTVPLYSNLP